VAKNVYRVKRNLIKGQTGNVSPYVNNYVAETAVDACRQDEEWYKSYDSNGDFEITEVVWICQLNSRVE
jgi:hypothetical protein